MVRRIAFAVCGAAVVTFGLLWSMQALVSIGYKLKKVAPRISVEFVRLHKDTPPKTKERKPPQREKPEPPPAPPDISTSQARLDPGQQGIAAVAPTIDPSDALGGGVGTSGGTDRDVVPMVQIKPEYPLRAAQRGIEGWVTVEYTITPAGTVKDARVVAAHPARIFDRAALQAVRKWKYNPKIENGQAVERPGVQYTLLFELGG